MELLLNLAWLLLALAAGWSWRARKIVRTVDPLQCLLALGCLLVLLFPVVSATDDLRAMRAEMEESPTSKRSLRQSSADRTTSVRHAPAAVSRSFGLFVPSDEVWQAQSALRLILPHAPEIHRSSRAPPLPA